MEIWRDIKGYEGLYQVSSLGRVKSLPKEKPNFLTGGSSLSKELILKPGLTKGYEHVKLGKTVRVHRLVAIAFLPNPDNKPLINHIDGNKTNNCVDNLEWCTNSENDRHAFNAGLRSNVGIKHSQSKLTELEVLTIRKLYPSISQGEIAKAYSVSRSCIQAIVLRKSWTHI